MKYFFLVLFILLFTLSCGQSSDSRKGSYNVSSQNVDKDRSCRNGANTLFNLYIRLNPIYSIYYGTPEEYIAQNRGLFQGGDVNECAKKVARALLNSSIQTFDRNALNRRAELNAQLGAMGISPGQAEMNPSAVLFTTGQQILQLSKCLPGLLQGGASSNCMSQEQVLVSQLMNTLLQDSFMQSTLQQIKPLILQAAEADFQFLMSIANEI